MQSQDEIPAELILYRLDQLEQQLKSIDEHLRQNGTELRVDRLEQRAGLLNRLIWVVIPALIGVWVKALF